MPLLINRSFKIVIHAAILSVHIIVFVIILAYVNCSTEKLTRFAEGQDGEGNGF